MNRKKIYENLWQSEKLVQIVGIFLIRVFSVVLWFLATYKNLWQNPKSMKIFEIYDTGHHENNNFIS